VTQSEHSRVLPSNIDPLLDRPVRSPFWLPPEQRWVDPSTHRLATRARRLAAALLDFVFMFGLIAVSQLGAGVAAIRVGLAPIVFLQLLAVAGAQLFFLARDGQTLGKKLLGIRIVRAADGRPAGFVRALVLRSFVNNLFAWFWIYALVDAVFIFRTDRRCVHDLLAGTKVVRA